MHEKDMQALERQVCNLMFSQLVAELFMIALEVVELSVTERSEMKLFISRIL